MLYLNKEHILNLMDCDLMINSIEEAYKKQRENTYTMPDRMHVNYEDNTLLFMPCIIENSFGTKLVTVFPENKQKNLPVVDGIMVLNDVKTGVVKALLDGQILTAIRTGAVGATAIKHLAEAAKSVGIIGTGIQGYYQTLFAEHVLTLEKIYVYDRSCKYEHFKSLYGDRLVICDHANEVVENAEVIVTATTAYEPIFDTQKIKGKLFVGIGSYKPNMREYSDAFINQVETILIDTEFASSESGDLKIPLDKGIIQNTDIHLFSEYGQISCGESIFFKSVGMALFDVVVAEALYNKAVSMNLGQKLEG